jgi:hypothetical protein
MDITTLKTNESVLVYGPSKSGKTRLVATAAKMPRIKRIPWFDGENGATTLLNMGLTPAELAKIQYIKIPDTRDTPYFIETMLKALTSKIPVRICDTHGRVTCPECSKLPTYPHEVFDMRSLTRDDVIVIDSGSQLGNSAIASVCMGKDIFYKLQIDDWGNVRKYLTDILSVVQQAQYTNFVMITQELQTEGRDLAKKDHIDKIYPLIGSKAFCAEVSKYFGTIVHTHLFLGKHKAASASTYKPDLITGARNNALIEKLENPDMSVILGD